MRRFYYPQLQQNHHEIIELPGEVARHLSTVLRLQPGAQFELFDGQGTVAHCTLLQENHRAKINKRLPLTTPEFKIELIQALPKGEKLELILQKGTELGLARFLLTPSARTVVKLKPAKKESRLDRWQKIVQEACRQCGQPFVPEVEISPDFTSTLARTQGELKLMLWEEASTPLPQLLPQQRPTSISLLVGPEGGFSTAEAEQAQAAGFQTLRLGPRILRTETAGLAILSILQYVYGDLILSEGGFSSSMNGKELS